MDKISALMDGELSEQETRHNLSRLKQSPECCETWATFHLIGDAMRGEWMLGDNFTSRICGRLADEPTVVAPRFTYKRMVSYMLSAAASLAAVVFVLALVVTTENPFHTSQQVAQVAASSQPVSKAKINEYLMAHQEFSPSTTLQGVAPYVRTVSDDTLEDR